MNRSNKLSRLGLDIVFVKISDRFVSVSSLAILTVADATASLQAWYATLWCFLFNTDSGVDEFLYTASLLQNIFAGRQVVSRTF